MNRFKCPACGGNQYTSCDTAQGCIYCVYKGLLELMDPAGVEKTGEEVDEQLIKLLQSDKEELKRWIKRMKYHCNKVNELRIELNKYQKLLKRIESSPKMPIERWTGDEREIICPAMVQVILKGTKREGIYRLTGYGMNYIGLFQKKSRLRKSNEN